MLPQLITKLCRDLKKRKKTCMENVPTNCLKSPKITFLVRVVKQNTC